MMRKRGVREGCGIIPDVCVCGGGAVSHRDKAEFMAVMHGTGSQ